MDQEQGRTAFSHSIPVLLSAALIVVLLAPSASALLTREKKTAETRQAGAPIAHRLTARVYRDIPYTGRFAATDQEGDEMSFCISEQPRHGSVSCDGDSFTYLPQAGYLGSDSFTYLAQDVNGSCSLPAAVQLTVMRTHSGVKYDDMEDCSAYTAAVDLAEHGVFVGAEIGGSRFFEPEHIVSRAEFTAMALAAAGEKAAGAAVTGFCDDAAIPTWAKGCAVSALQSGLIRGVGTEQGIAFRSASGVTLAEAATILNRLLCVTDVSCPQENAQSAWYAQAAANLESVSVLPAGAFAEGDAAPLDRAEAAELLSAAISVMEARRGGGLLTGLFR